ncbi:nucleotidyltransferase [Hymenobacter sp. ISL-91]|uniref:nucleotidyltransferase n=1 Tax=Hymenobacter sp. ISL-91 TaxID=2819151 RepID=UPI001BE945A0|nr:DUF6036 family nucleotidyltransferase [Hymenobacter sp. ISL-91]MBT2558589.1 nucleotidyltransferase [Hymenobacter sp. ISL-91]
MQANQLSPDYKEFVGFLNAHAVEYLVVGAYALARYGIVRNTGDIDFWINQTPENVERLLLVLNDFGVGSLGYSVPDLLEPDTVIQLGVSPIRIDLLTSVDGVEFNECYPARQISVLDDVPVAVISLADLRKNKGSTGRAKDIEDVRLLDSKEQA